MSGTYTTFMRLSKPEFGFSPWDSNVNGNMDIIDGFIGQYLRIPNFIGAWQNLTYYGSGQVALDTSNSTMWLCAVAHTSAPPPSTFQDDREAHPTYWTEASTEVTGIPDAPADNRMYGRKNSTWQDISATSSVLSNRNALDNPLYLIQQRGIGPFGPVTANYVATADRWWTQCNIAGSQTTNLVQLTDGQRTSIGDDQAEWGLRTQVTGSATAGAGNIIMQNVEQLRRFSGKRVIVSFWIWASTGTPTIGCNLTQKFSAGGSADVQMAGQSVVISTTPARYSFVFDVPSSSGKVFGSGVDYTQMAIWMSAASNQSTLSGGVPVQSGTFTMWGPQLEIAQSGQVAPTPLDKKFPGEDYRNCARYYTVRPFQLWGYTTATNGIGTIFQFPVHMVVTPTINATYTTTTNCGTNLVTALSGDAYRVQTSNVPATGPINLVGSFTAVAEI